MIMYDGAFKATREKTKKRYKVYARIKYIYNGMGVDGERVEFLGETTATSSKKAVNNVAYRFKVKPYDLIPLWGDGAKETELFAEVCKDNGDTGGHETASGEAR